MFSFQPQIAARCRSQIVRRFPPMRHHAANQYVYILLLLEQMLKRALLMIFTNRYIPYTITMLKCIIMKTPNLLFNFYNQSIQV